ncbi:MAG: 23S rRNA (uracil(1939)-C(5))-methyltransferase RlmD [bacterium]|nr:23S rRNA (uracil(1939)-C(5))-methyltransferase RlmD [bacterium]
MPQLKIEKLVFGGQGLGRIDEKATFVWNALPGEEVEAHIVKNSKSFSEAIATKIIFPAPYRQTPCEDHYLSCSPWQILPLAEENKWKKIISEENYKKIGGIEWPNLEIVGDDHEYGYRNKIEYSFAVDENNEIRLAFFDRASHHRSPITPCKLAHPNINIIAERILNWVKTQNLTLRNLKCAIIRSNQKGEVIVGLFIKDQMSLANFPELDKILVGLKIYYSTHKSPAAVPTAEMYSAGQDYLEERINSVKLQYGLFSFFQVNPPVFEKALADIKKFVDPKIPLVDYYSGVGAIGLGLNNPKQEMELVESNIEAVEYAKKNIELNKIKNCTAECRPAEKMIELITADKTIILDPPRAGLDNRLIQRLLETKPKTIIYMSCNLSTHARDLQLLLADYKLEFLKLYNFFPHTAHIEGLAVLKLK